jgi:nucleotide-binding universal stress UspA family protein
VTKHILVATDGSDTAQKAITLAAELAAKFDVPLTVGHVLQYGRLADEMARMAEVEHIVDAVKGDRNADFAFLNRSGGGLINAGTGPSQQTMRAISLIGEEIVKRAAEHARDLGAKTVGTRVVMDDPADGILDMAEEAGADMIVLGHRGLGRVRALLAGSVAQKVNHNAECTVVTVR